MNPFVPPSVAEALLIEIAAWLSDVVVVIVPTPRPSAIAALPVAPERFTSNVSSLNQGVVVGLHRHRLEVSPGAKVTVPVAAV